MTLLALESFCNGFVGLLCLLRMYFCSGFVFLATWLFCVGCWKESNHIRAWMADRVSFQGVSSSF